MDKHVTRRAPHMERYVKIAPVIVEGSPDAHSVMLQVEAQSFRIDYSCDTLAEAEWMRDMLCIALDTMGRQVIAAPVPAPRAEGEDIEVAFDRWWNDGEAPNVASKSEALWMWKEAAKTMRGVPPAPSLAAVRDARDPDVEHWMAMQVAAACGRHGLRLSPEIIKDIASTVFNAALARLEGK